MEKGQAETGLQGRDLPLGDRRRRSARAQAALRGERGGHRSARLQASLADRLVFAQDSREPRRARCATSCPAARRCRPSIAEFFQGIGLPIIEGYGLTETSPILTVNPPDAPRVGTVGQALPGVELRIADDGEILARGPNIMLGLLQQAGGDRRGAARRLVPHRRHRHHRRARLPAHHRSQEGSARHVRRQEDRAAADRRRPEAQSARRRGRPARRSPQVRGGADRARASPRSSAA